MKANLVSAFGLALGVLIVTAAAGAGGSRVVGIGDGVAFADSSDGDPLYLDPNDLDNAYLGVRLREETEHPEGGARVTEVIDDSPAERAGIEVDDIIVGFDGHVIRGPVALTERIHAKESGDRVQVAVLRDGKKRTLEVELGKRETVVYSLPNLGLDTRRLKELGEQYKQFGESMRQYSRAPKARAFAPLGFWQRPVLGVELVEPTPELRRHLGADEDAGVLVSKVLSGMPAERAGIRVGDLIVSVGGDPVADVGELREALDEREESPFEIRLVRDRKRISVQVTIESPEVDRPTGPRAGLAPLPPRPPLAPGPRIAPRPAVAPAPPPPLPDASPRLAPAPMPAPAPVLAPTPLPDPPLAPRIAPPAPPAPPARSERPRLV